MKAETEFTNHPAVQFRIARPTNKFDEILRFYTKGLKLQLLSSFEGHSGYRGAMIGLPSLQYHLEFTEDQNGTSGIAPSRDNLLVLYFRRIDELTTIKQSLEELGHQPVIPENPY